MFSNINIQMSPGDALQFQWHHFRLMGTRLLREDPSRRKPPFCPYMNLYGAGLRKNSGGQKSENFSNFFVRKWSQKASRIIYTTFFAEIRPISPRFEPILWHVWGDLAVFWLYHAHKTAFFLEKIFFPVWRGLLGADKSPWGENGVIVTAEHPRGTFGY